jgi:hypothetical protein
VNEPTVPDVPMVHKSYQAEPGRDMQEMPPTTPTLHLEEVLVHHDHVIVDSTGSVEGQNIQVNDILPMTEQVRPVSTQASAPEPVPVQEMIPAQETVSSDSDISLLQSFLNIGRQLHNAL